MTGSRWLAAFVLTVVFMSSCRTARQTVVGKVNKPHTDRGPTAVSRASLQRTGLYNTKGPRQLQGIAWEFETKRWTDHFGYVEPLGVSSDPIIVDDVLYFSMTHRRVYCVDAKSGKEKWRFRTPHLIYASPAVSDGAVFIGDGEGNFYALDADTGQVQWEFDARTATDTSPAVFDGVVYLGCSNGSVYALDAATGKLKWKTSGFGRPLNSSPAIADSTLYIGTIGKHSMYALELETGKKLWRFRARGMIFGPPAISGGKVFFGTDEGHFYAVDCKTGKQVWRLRGMDAIRNGAAVCDDLVFFGDWDFLYAVDAATGQEKWRLKGRVSSSPSIADGVVYFGTAKESVCAADITTGKELWRIRLTRENAFGIDSSPAIADGVIYVGSSSGGLYAIH